MSNSNMKKGRFSDIKPKRTNSFRRNRPSKISVPKATGRWAKLDNDKNDNNDF